MKKIINTFLILAVAGFSSCLKDDSLIGPDAPGALSNVIEFANPGAIESSTSAPYALFSKGLDIGESQDMVLTVQYAGANTAPNDITVNLGIKPEAISAYNESKSDDPDFVDFTLLPTSLYTLPASVIIPKGQRTTSITVKLKTDQFDLLQKYVLPITVMSASTGTISGNFGTILLAVNAKNKYDGVYHSTGVFSHPTAGPRDIDQDKTLSTAGPNSVTTTVGDLGNLMTLTINEATNDVTVSGSISASQPLVPVPGKTNTYDPATKTFHLNYQYTGGGGFRVINEDIVKGD